MFELRPPGSFPLCRDTTLQEVAAEDLKRISAAVQEAVNPFPALGLLLTGSVARGEGTLIGDPQVGSRWLGDIECQLVFDDRRSAQAAEIDSRLCALEQHLNEDPENRRRGMKIGLKAVGTSRLARLRPAIFTCEMLEHAKLLWGEPDEIPQPEWWIAGKRQVPLQDAFRLLNNRIVQQVEARARRESGEAAPLYCEYALNKFWIELATSLSLFLECYRSSYRDRQKALETQLARNSYPLSRDRAQLLVSRLREAMAVKEGSAPPEIHSDAPFSEAAEVALEIWYWEAGRLAGRECEPGDWKSILPLLARIDTTAQRARDWGRFLLRRRTLRELRPGMTGICRIALEAGSVGNLIYGAASMLEFFWRDLEAGSAIGWQVSEFVGSLFRARPSVPFNRSIVALAVANAWDGHLRFAPM